MSVKNYRFVSPGVFVNEIDNSQVPASPAGIGPVIIGRAEKGPALRPTTVNSFEEFVNVFGAPAPGGSGGDVWREGNDTTATTYGAYAAQAYLRNSSPLTYVRLLGSQASGYTVDSGEAGWDKTNAWAILVGEAPGNAGGERPWRQGNGFDFVLAGIVYAPDTVLLELSGAVAVSGAAAPSKSDRTAQGSSWIISDTGVAKEFKLVMTGSGPSAAGSTVVFNFDRTSSKYIRKVLNTNPQLTNDGITAAGTRLNYWLGETFDRHLASNITGSQTWGAIVRINNTAGAANGSAGNHEAALQAAQTPQIIACRTSNNPTSRPLFKVVALNEPGDWSNRNLKISIQDIKRSPDNDNDYGTFSVVVRHLSDSDNVVRVLEQFNNCDLNPDSLNYLGRKIGTKYTSWSATERRYVEYGDWANVSKYIRVDINSDVDAGLTSADLLPFGFQGIVKYKDPTSPIVSADTSSTWLTGSVRPSDTPEGLITDTAATAVVTFTGTPVADETITIEDTAGLTKVYLAKAIQTLSNDPPQFSITGSVTAQALSLEACIDCANGHNGTIVTTPAAGVLTLTQNTAGEAGNNTITETLTDTTVTGFSGGNGAKAGNLLISLGGTAASIYYPTPELRVSASDGNLPNTSDAYFGYQTTTDAGGSVFDRSNIDLLRARGAIVSEMFEGDASTERSITFTLDDVSGSQGSWISGSFAEATAPAQSLTRVNGLVAGVLDAGFDRFTVPMYGGFDGTNITEMDAFANRNISGNDKTNYVFNSIRQAIDSLADPEVVQMNLASMPGLTNEGLSTNLVRLCEDRADALAVIDLKDAFQPREEADSVNRLNLASTISTIVTNLRSLNLNSSYGCAYYPWVRARDTINGAFVWLPPSVPAIGTFSSSQRKTQVWFAPAGFNRGGLTEGSAGIPVVDVAHQLRRKDRDDLYSSNVNPIAKFPNEGIVIFGQKTLQVTPSALDRINVRRLMIFVKKRISQIASQLLFDPNVQQTWLRFKGQVDPFLANVKTNFGLSDYKVILDETTTTPDLVDQNIMYAKIFLKPTRAIEYIAIDFNITRTGASFTD